MNYIKKFFSTDEKEEYSWISGLILFQDEKKMILDRGFIITGDLENYPYYCQFKNFNIINGELYYLYPNCMKKINPEKVFLHLRIGKSPFPIEKDNLTYWHLFFTSPNNRVYKSIDIIKEKIKLHEFPEKKTKKDLFENPLFIKKQVYENGSVLFSNLKIFDIL